MKLNEICSTRRIAKASKNAPLIIPSFSSKGFSELIYIYQKVKDQILDYSLVSAYDISYKLLPKEIYSSDLLFIDSGGYEKRVDADLAEIYKDRHIPKPWDVLKYKTVLNSIKPLTKIAIVSFDNIRPISIDKQIANAKKLFEPYDKYIYDFLCKPSPKKSQAKRYLIDIDEWIANIPKLHDFDIIGFTEKELGVSIEERCKNIVRFRQALLDLGMNTPIHIFGCIDPLNILAYFLCGADIFDGLMWLRLSFHSQSGLPIYRNSYAISKKDWSIQDERYKILTYGENLKLLSILNSSMTKFARTYDWSILDNFFGEQLKDLVCTAGIDI